MGYDITTVDGREKMRAYQRAWRAKNAAVFKAKARERHLVKTYGVTLAQVDAMLATQAWLCAACSREIGNHYGVDHDHKTGAVRALLCNQCNAALGMVDDSIPRLQALIRYLESFATREQS